MFLNVSDCSYCCKVLSYVTLMRLLFLSTFDLTHLPRRLPTKRYMFYRHFSLDEQRTLASSSLFCLRLPSSSNHNPCWHFRGVFRFLFWVEDRCSIPVVHCLWRPHILEYVSFAFEPLRGSCALSFCMRLQFIFYIATCLRTRGELLPFHFVVFEYCRAEPLRGFHHHVPVVSTFSSVCVCAFSAGWFRYFLSRCTPESFFWFAVKRSMSSSPRLNRHVQG